MLFKKFRRKNMKHFIFLGRQKCQWGSPSIAKHRQSDLFLRAIFYVPTSSSTVPYCLSAYLPFGNSVKCVWYILGWTGIHVTLLSKWGMLNFSFQKSTLSPKTRSLRPLELATGILYFFRPNACANMQNWILPIEESGSSGGGKTVE